MASSGRRLFTRWISETGMRKASATRPVSPEVTRYVSIEAGERGGVEAEDAPTEDGAQLELDVGSTGGGPSARSSARDSSPSPVPSPDDATGKSRRGRDDAASATSTTRVAPSSDGVVHVDIVVPPRDERAATIAPDGTELRPRAPRVPSSRFVVSSREKHEKCPGRCNNSTLADP